MRVPRIRPPARREHSYLLSSVETLIILLMVLAAWLNRVSAEGMAAEAQPAMT